MMPTLFESKYNEVAFLPFPVTVINAARDRLGLVVV